MIVHLKKKEKDRIQDMTMTILSKNNQNPT